MFLLLAMIINPLFHTSPSDPIFREILFSFIHPIFFSSCFFTPFSVSSIYWCLLCTRNFFFHSFLLSSLLWLTITFSIRLSNRTNSFRFPTANMLPLLTAIIPMQTGTAFLRQYFMQNGVCIYRSREKNYNQQKPRWSLGTVRYPADTTTCLHPSSGSPAAVTIHTTSGSARKCHWLITVIYQHSL